MRAVASLPIVALAFVLGACPVAARAHGLPDFTRLVEQVSPAVVNISTTQKRSEAKPSTPHGLDIPGVPDDLRDFFRRFFEDSDDAPGEHHSRSLGSGFIISPDGYVLTNHHVVEEADEIIVRLADRREFRAETVGSDQRSDIALLKVDAHDLPVVRIAHDAKSKVGEWVLAIGSPFGFDHSATAGIISALGRSLPSESYVPFIQTDVAINPGNSGGPLFNLDGEVIGVNSQIYSRTGGYMGLSFAIPIDVAMDVVRQLRERGYVSRGYLGVLIQDVTLELAESFGMDTPSGALVARVLPDSAAEKGGLEVGDVIVAFNSEPVTSSSALPPMVGRTPVGEEVPVQVLREGETRVLRLVLGELPSEEDVKLARKGPQGGLRDARLGLVVADLDAEERETLQAPDHGVVIEAVREGGPAARAGLRQGDLLLRLDHVKIEDAERYREVSQGLRAGSSVPVLVQRDGSPIFLPLRVPED
jgi:serine protease Do